MTEVFTFRPEDVRSSNHRKMVHQFMDWGTVRVDIVKRTGLERQETNITLDRHSFLINLKGEAKLGEDFIEGKSVGFTPRRPGSLVFIPANHEWKGWDEGDAVGSYLAFSIDASFTEKVLRPEHVRALRPTIGFRDNVIENALQNVGMELRNPDSISMVVAESQAVQIFAQLIRLNGAKPQIIKGGLSSFDLKRVVSIIEDSVSAPPSLEELAATIGLSRRHFFRAFKQSTGKTPHTYLSDYRLKCAVDLLRNANVSATEIALACGFSSSSHFTYAFKRLFGVSPLEYRRRWRR
ncbi:helix-turn-helix transcriptional regulator [Agrobacterium sp. T29]|uniref:helix-turn-helix transcriptional regulator n=1 Tax=Agrobacterium sp. T29 TaxID=2580515 RepID=UPI001FEF732E|nr:AraC family transcriptional regulator [Agrobacterium sp. T29]